MDLSDAVLALVAPLSIGDELEGARLTRVSTELGIRLTFERDDERVHVEAFPADRDRPHAARSDRWLFGYRAGGVASPERALALCRAVAKLAEANEGSLPVADATATERVREVRGGQLLEKAGTPERPYLTLSPYVGCLIGCRFCYAQDRVGMVRRLQGLPEVPWGSYVDARIDAPEQLARELEALEPVPIKLCPIVSDPYQAIEAKLRLTRRCLEVLRDARPRPVFVLTRARLIERDADVLEAMPDARAGFSIPTADDDVAAWFEPRAAPPTERLEVLRALSARGVETFAVVQPPLPGDVARLADALAGATASVSLDVLHGEQGAEALFDRYPEVREAGWQRDRLAALREALEARGVATWDGELPA